MDLEFIALSFSQTNALIAIFIMGMLAFKLGLPPMVGFLAVGFLLKMFGVESSQAIREIADLGVTLMLFTIGLKLNLGSLLRVQIWGVASLHMIITIIIYSLIFFALTYTNLSAFTQLNYISILIISFALSFSSTVFAVKVIEGNNEMNALYAHVAIGILIVQDIFAVIFLTASTGKIPSLWALCLLILPFVRPLLYKIMDEVKHGELLVLYSLLLAVGGAGLFELVGMKADLGALIFGIMLAGHAKSSEVSNTLYSFKDLFLIAFFVNIGLSGKPTFDHLILALFLSVLMFGKVALFFWLSVKTHLRARTSFLMSLSLANYSEFGLIVGAIAVTNGWISSEWLIIMAIALSITFAIASPLNHLAHDLYAKYSPVLRRWQSDKRVFDDRRINISGAKTLIFGMGRVGIGVYENLRQYQPKELAGIDFDAEQIRQHQEAKRKVVYADVMDKDFWSKINLQEVEQILLCLPHVDKNKFILEQLQKKQFTGDVSAIAMYDDEIDILKQAGAKEVYNFYSEAGTGFSEHVRLKSTNIFK